jgi:hypothetical protein
MSRWLLIPARLLAFAITLAVAASFACGVSDAWAGNEGGQNGTHASASAGHGAVTVSVGSHRHHQPQAGDPTTTPPSSGSPSGSGASTPTTDPTGSSAPQAPPAPTYTCTSGPINLVEFQKLLGVGGPEPGYWALTECTGPGAPAPSPPFWVVVGQPGTPGAAGAPAPPPSPAVVALQAEKQLELPATTIEMAPPSTSPQLVNVSVWLWQDAATWKTYTATASIDGVSATATATPEEVVWNMGDGHTVTCDGPGTPYNPSDLNAATSCSYTWTAPSVNEPNGAYDVTATTKWQVTWTAIGTAGGGSLGLVAGPVANAEVVVTESQAINTPGATAANAGNPGGQ